ncbi:hypothetical protein BHE74_00005074 [Ensete ventricosum]|nr:hypothetical protein BHE74_00005074 [Ensete ventricosum]RZR89906.1 hypothetical protein BHM03_00017704 [Ensete ventricosum]
MLPCVAHMPVQVVWSPCVGRLPTQAVAACTGRRAGRLPGRVASTNWLAFLPWIVLVACLRIWLKHSLVGLVVKGEWPWATVVQAAQLSLCCFHSKASFVD